ncbi:MAG TPA: lycopene cyclase domain-containing protein [Cellulomonadaceae bacterium]|nr:lycopene cyclase domain-containing protein [Cellulomonadaceae bacterium]
MIRGLYLGALVVSLASMAVMDRRWRLFLWADAWRGAIVLVTGVVLFLSWDAAAIRLGFFERGHGQALVGVEIAPHLPLEELFFVTFLSYLTMVGHALVRRVLDRRAARLAVGSDHGIGDGRGHESDHRPDHQSRHRSGHEVAR